MGRAVLEALRQIVALPEVVGAHACECGHPEMRRLPTGSSTARPAARRSFPPKGAEANKERRNSDKRDRSGSAERSPEAERRNTDP